LTPTIASLDAAEALDRMARERSERFPIHLKIDSGFGRIGVSLPNALPFIREVAQKPGLLIDGIYTHFASSDCDPEYTLLQAREFLAVVAKARKLSTNNPIVPRWIHLANSSAVIRFPETHGNLVRPGLAFYGIQPYPGAEKDVALKPALTWKTRVIFLKIIPKGGSVSYARTWIARRTTRVATLAVGYADGLRRIVSNKGQILVGGHRVPILGRVTMDMTMVDVTDLPLGRGCRVGDEAVLLGSQGAETISANEMAEWAGTNAYEILCGIGIRVPKIILHG
jgi:alanine racemase